MIYQARKKPRKCTNREIEERREKVLQLRLRGLGYKAIADVLQVSHLTIRRDLEIIRGETKEQVKGFCKEYAIGRCMQTYQAVLEKAWENYDTSAPGSAARVHYLQLIKATQSDEAKLLMDVGLIGRAAVQVEHRMDPSAALSGWTRDAQQLVALAIIKAQLPPPGEPQRIINIPDDTTPRMLAEEATGGGGNGRGEVVDEDDGRVVYQYESESDS
jgi:hypothetical protein